MVSATSRGARVVALTVGALVAVSVGAAAPAWPGGVSSDRSPPAVSAPVVDGPVVDGPATAADVRRFLDEQAEALRLPSLAVVVVKDGEPFVEHHVGGVDGATPYVLGSTSKQLTGLAVQALVADGRLRLDDRLGDLVPDLEPATPEAGSVTVRQLLGHTSGWSTAVGLRKWGWFARAPDSIRGEAEAVAQAPLARPPGSGFEYTNAGYDVLGAVIEEVTGTPFATALRDLVLGPLGLTRTTADPAEAGRWGVAADHYTWFGSVTVPTPAPRPAGGVPSALIVSSAEDLSRLLRAHLGTLDTQLSDTVLGAARRPVTEVNDVVGYGSGWFVRRLWEATPPGGDWRDPTLPQCVEHEGSIDRSMTTMLACPDPGLGVVALSNVGAAPDDLRLQRLRVELVHLLLGTNAPPRERDLLVAWSTWILVGLPLVHGGLVATWVVLRRRGLRRWPLAVLAVVTPAFSVGVLWLALWHVPRRDGTSRTIRSLWTTMPDLGVVTVIAVVLTGVTGWLVVRTALDRRLAPSDVAVSPRRRASSL